MRNIKRNAEWGQTQAVYEAKLRYDSLADVDACGVEEREVGLRYVSPILSLTSLWRTETEQNVLKMSCL